MLTKEAANMYTLRARYRRNEPLEIAHTTTPTSRRVQRNQTVYSYGPGTFSPIYAPVRSAWLVRLTLRKPRHYFQGVGGSGAPPLAMITEPSPWVTTTVLRLIAPTKTSMASRITVSLRDIVPPGYSITPERVYISAHQCQAG